MDKRLTSKNTPLRNSNKFSNTPFRSPINTAAAAAGLTPKNNKLSRSVDSLKAISKEITKENTTPKRPHSVDENSLVKRRRIQVVDNIGDDGSSTRADLSALRRRIRNKKQEIESIKVKLSYRNKHQSKDLNSEIIQWRSVCHEALVLFQREWNANNSEGLVLSDMSQVIKELQLSPAVVRFPDD